LIFLEDNSNRLNLLIIRDTLPRGPLVELTNILTYKDIIPKKRERNYSNNDFVFISDLLNPSNLQLLI
jgi:hypothetical protein